jgi:hypothetical protein
MYVAGRVPAGTDVAGAALGSANVLVGFTATSGVFVAVTTKGVTPGAFVAVAPVVEPDGVVVSCAIAEPVANPSTGPKPLVGANVPKTLFCGKGVNVGTADCEYGLLHADSNEAISNSVEAIIMPRFNLVMEIFSSISNKVSVMVAYPHSCVKFWDGELDG